MSESKKYISLSVLMLLIVFVLAACGSKNSDSNNDEDMKITAIKYTWSEPPAKDGAGIQAINEKLGVDYSLQFVPESDYNEKLTAIVTGGDIPDMVATRSLGPVRLNFLKWAEQGAFLPLDDYIDDLEYKDYIPKHVWDSNTVNGKVYGIPTYYPQYKLTPIIRKDWLDNLGLDVPTSYEELKEVAIAFTNDDPDQNGEDDTYGMVLGEGINPRYAFGPYWDEDWYHQDEDGNYIPGLISEGRKEVIEVLHELYTEKAITQDFALLNHADSEKEFYSGKAGIFYGSSYGMKEANVETLLELDPDAEMVVIPPFEAPDGSYGYPFEIGYLGNVAISAKNKGNEEKIEKMLEIINMGKVFFSWDDRTPDNELYDWLYGHEGEGYEIGEDGPVTLDANKQPIKYLVDERSWPPSPEAMEEWKSAKIPQLGDLTKNISEMHQGIQHYSSPVLGLVSETEMKKGEDLNQLLEQYQVKMIAGELPISEWDKMVEEYMNKGGKEIIEEYNQQIEENNLAGTWE